LELPELCEMTSKLTLRKYDRPVDKFSAMSFSVNLGKNTSKFHQRLSTVDWGKILQVEIPGLEEGEELGYTKRFDFINGQLYLSLNFT